MPRKRELPDFVPQHIVNRGNRKAVVFRCEADYIGFIGAMAWAAEQTVVRLIAYILMPNHFHLVLWPYSGAEISTYMEILMNTHLHDDLLPRHELAGMGHVYQRRYYNDPIKNDFHFLNVVRYVESNALRAGLVDRAELWPWSSLATSGPDADVNLLAPWPVRRPADWLHQVNQSVGAREVSTLWTPADVSATSVSVF